MTTETSPSTAAPSYGRLVALTVHRDDLDALSMLHNARYPVLPACTPFHLWVERLGTTSLTYGFRFCAAGGGPSLHLRPPPRTVRRTYGAHMTRSLALADHDNLKRAAERLRRQAQAAGEPIHLADDRANPALALYGPGQLRCTLDRRLRPPGSRELTCHM
jgi:acyl-CoA thioester hydrolase